MAIWEFAFERFFPIVGRLEEDMVAVVASLLCPGVAVLAVGADTG